MSNKLDPKYSFKEPTVGDVPELFKAMTGAEFDNTAVMESLIKNCILVNGQPIGDGYQSIPIREMQLLVTEVLKKAGMSGKV